MLISLKSDFRDYYDHIFAGSWQQGAHCLERLSTAGPERRVMFDILKGLKLVTPHVGTVSELNAILMGEFSYLGSSSLIDDYMRNLTDVVVYLDNKAHRGEGKIRLNIKHAIKEYPNHFASQYIPSTARGFGVSLRYLRIGRRQFWLRYTSRNDWRSNVGDVCIEVLSEEVPKSLNDILKLSEPMLAIDFVKADKLYAIDYNVAPGLMGTGIEALLTPSDIFEELKVWFSYKKATAECNFRIC